MPNAPIRAMFVVITDFLASEPTPEELLAYQPFRPAWTSWRAQWGRAVNLRLTAEPALVQLWGHHALTNFRPICRLKIGQRKAAHHRCITDKR